MILRWLCLWAFLAGAAALGALGAPEAPAPASGPASAPATQPAGITEDIYRACLDWFDKAQEKVDKMVPAAEAAAERLAAGGTLYIAGNAGLVDELEYRAGGFPFSRPWADERLSNKDVLLVGYFRPNEMQDRHAHLTFIAGAYGRRFGDGMLVHFASHRWPQVSRVLPAIQTRSWDNRLYLFDTGAPSGGGPVESCLGQLSTTALVWAFSGEVIAAATRKGKTLATYASDWEPGGRAWDESVKDQHLHPTRQVPPIEAGKLGRRYLAICREQVAEFVRTSQPAQVRLAGQRLAACMKAGGAVWITCDGHVHPRGSVVPAELTGVIFQGRSYDWGNVGRNLQASDMLLYVGYLRYPKSAVSAARQRGSDVVVVSVDDGPTDAHLTHIRGCWKDYDTVIDLPQYPIRVLPSSGVVQTPQWYALMAETLRAMGQGR